jgi:hypothetical protein
MSPATAARSVRVPALVHQIHDHVMTRPSDVQAIFDNIPAEGCAEKDLFWIEGTTRRRDGYLHFRNDPARVLDWLARHAR